MGTSRLQDLSPSVQRQERSHCQERASPTASTLVPCYDSTKAAATQSSWCPHVGLETYIGNRRRLSRMPCMGMFCSKRSRPIQLSTRFSQAIQGDLIFYADETGQDMQAILHYLASRLRMYSVDCRRRDPQRVGQHDHGSHHHTVDATLRAPEIMIWVGESSLSAGEAKVWADCWNIELIIRPKDEEARVAERHHHSLRTLLSKHSRN